MDDYPTRADEVRETWKRKEKPVTPIERLRALEKKIAGESERAKQSRDRDAKIEAHSAAAFHSGRAWAYEDVLELLRPLLATASEQAPVVLARGFFHRDETDEDGDYEIFGSKDDRCEKCIPCLIVTGSPAHTSEARDACKAKYLPAGSMILGDQDYETTKPCFEVVHRGFRYYMSPTSKQSIARLNEQDAAMRQEAE